MPLDRGHYLPGNLLLLYIHCNSSACSEVDSVVLLLTSGTRHLIHSRRTPHLYTTVPQAQGNGQTCNFPIEQLSSSRRALQAASAVSIYIVLLVSLYHTRSRTLYSCSVLPSHLLLIGIEVASHIPTSHISHTERQTRQQCRRPKSQRR